MADKTIKVQINSAITGGFKALVSEMKAVQESLKGVEALAKSVNKLTTQLGNGSGTAKAISNLKRAADATKAINKYADDGVKIAARNASEQTKLINSISRVNAAKKSGAIDEKKRLEAEISLLDRYIKKTGDIAVLSRRGSRSDRGQFFSVSSGARSTLTPAAYPAASRFTTDDPQQSSRIKNAVANITKQGNMYEPSFDKRSDQQAFYNKQFDAIKAKATSTAAGIRKLSFGPKTDKGPFSRLLAEYSHIGRAIFNLQLATGTFLAASGVGEILKLADSYTTLRNQIALTSASTEDIGKNMKEVFAISKEYFLDPKAVATTYAQINGLRDAIGLNKDQVKGVSQAISGAFGASSGEASSRNQAQYQLGQALSSNKLGGDELRSIAENADFVKYILNKYGATARGGKVGDPIQLYGSKTPLGTKEIASIFGRKDVQDEITKANAGKARTFGDALNVGKTRLMELYGSFDNATKIFSRIANGLARWLADDTSFKKFTDALTLASIALSLFAAKAAGTAIGAAGKSLAARVFPEMAGGFGPDLSGSMRRRAGIVNAGRNAVGGLRAAGRFAANSPQLAGDALNGIASGFSKIGPLLKTSGKGIADFAVSLTKMGTWTKGLTGLMTGLGGAVKFVSSGLISVIAEFLGLGGILEVLGLPIIAIVAVIALLIYRFNSLLGSMNGGMNLMDIMVGLWEKLKRGFSSFMKVLDNSPLGPIIKGFEMLFSIIDKGIGWLVKRAGEDSDFTLARDRRMYGDATGSISVAGKDGGVYEGRVAKGRTGSSTVQYLLDDKGNKIKSNSGKAAYKVGDKPVEDNASLVTGFQNGVPELPATKTPGDRKLNRWLEFMRDMKLQVQETANYSGLTDFGKDMKSGVDDIRKKALDALDFDTSKFSTLDEAYAAYGKSKNNHVAEINKWTDMFSTTKMAEARKNLIEGLNSSLLTQKTNTRKVGMSANAGDTLDRTIDLIQRFTTMIKDESVKKAIDLALRQGNIAGAEDLIRQNQVLGGSKDSNGAVIDGRSYDTAKKQSNGAALDFDMSTLSKSILLQRQQIANAITLSGIYGSNKDTASSMVDLIDQQYEQYGDLLFTNSEYAAKLKEQLDLIQQQADVVKELSASWKDGVREGLQEYRDSIADFSTLFKDGINGALNSFEDNLVAVIQGSKADFSKMFSDLQAMMIKFALRRFVIKPILDWASKSKAFGGLFGDQGKLSDKVIQAKQVFVSGQIMPGTGTGTGANGFMSLFSGGSGATSGSASGGSGGWLKTAATIASFFLHSGGTVGGTSAMHNVSSSVFAHARRYHTGTNSAGSRALLNNEVPAILKMGETVLTRGQTGAISKSLQSGSNNQQNTFSPTIALTYHAGNGDSDTSQADAKAMTTMLKQMVQKELSDYAVKQNKPGSAMYNNGRK